MFTRIGRYFRTPIFRMMRRRLSKFLLIAALSATSSLLISVIPWASKHAVDSFGASFNWSHFLRTMAILFSVLIFRSSLSVISNWFTTKMQADILRELLEEVHVGMMNMPYREQIKYQSGELSSHAINDVQAIVSGFSVVVNAVVRYPVEVITLLVTLTLADFRLLLPTFIVGLSAILAAKGKSHRVSSKFLKTIQEKAKLFGIVNENMSMSKLIKLFNGTQQRIAVFRDSCHSFWQTHLRYRRERLLIIFLLELTTSVAVALGLLYVGFLVTSGKLEYNNLASAIAALLILVNSIRGLSNTWIQLGEVSKSGEYLESVINASATRVKDVQKKREFKEKIQSIDFRGIHFDYDGREILRGVDLRLTPGRPIILKGPNGAGKSTMIDLLFGIIEPAKGSIMINGSDRNELLSKDILARMSIVPQSIELFNDTIGYNIMFGAPDATPDDFERAIQLSNLRPFVESKQHCIDDVVGDRGTMLSLGERQKISIARALIRNPDVLILDEPTNNLDRDSYESTIQLIEDYSKEHIVLLITHEDIDPSINAVQYQLDNGLLTKC